MKKRNIILITLAVIVVIGLISAPILCLNHVDVTDIGIAYNSLNGNVHVQDKPGWYVTSPFTRVATLSLLPMRVQIPSSARIINQKIVRFRPEGALEFVKLQGFSMTLGLQQESIMLGYAYSGQRYTFLEIMEDPHYDTTKILESPKLFGPIQ